MNYSIYNNNKWNAAVDFIQHPNQSLRKVASTYDIAESTLIEALKRLANPTYKGNMRDLHGSNHMDLFKCYFDDRSPKNIATLFKAAKIPYPSELRKLLKQSANTETTSTAPKTSFKRCMECGTAIITGASFCYKCGTPITISADRVIELCDYLIEGTKLLHLNDEHRNTWVKSIKAIKQFAQEIHNGEKK